MIRSLLYLAVVLGVFGLGFYLRGVIPVPGQGEQHAEHQQGTASAATLWTCSMHPQIRQPRPGKCPICGMKLIPVTSSMGGLRQITISPDTRKLMQIQTTPVERKYVTATVRMVGKVTYDETRLGYITAWVAGRLDRMYVDYTGVRVQKSDHMVSIYSPELYSAQSDLVEQLKNQRRSPRSPSSLPELNFVDAAREKLRLLGMTPEQIKEVEQRGKPADHMTIQAPMGGIVVHKLRQEGDYVRVGDRIYAIADLNQVWVLLDAYESDLPWIRYGQEVTFTTEAYPGEQFVGRIAEIKPFLNDQTRTVKVRVNVPNEQGKLKPDMFVRGVVYSRIAAGGRVIDPDLAGKWISPMHPGIVKDHPGKCDICGMPLVRAEELGFLTLDEGEKTRPLVIPTSAALVTGTRAIVYVELPKKDVPTYEGREIVLGDRAGDYYLVRSGLKEGELVVSKGNFQIDSALQIQAKPSMMTPEGGGGGGHDHGHSGGTPDKKEMPGMPAVKIPAEVHKQLSQLEAAHKGVTEAVRSEKLEPARTAFNDFGKSLDAVQGKLLQGHALMVWDELAMLLRNDVVEGKDVKQLDDARRVLALLDRHMTRVAEQLGTSHDHGKPALVLATPTAFQRQLASVWEAYLALQRALAGDSLPMAQKAIKQVQASLDVVDARLLPDDLARGFWNKEKLQLMAILQSLEKGKDLKTLREGFSPLSMSVAVLVRTFGVSGLETVYQLRCSMAFGGRGASWLQKDDQPKNPYFGAAMLGCADQINKVAVPPAKDGKGDHHE